MFKCDLSSS